MKVEKLTFKEWIKEGTLVCTNDEGSIFYVPDIGRYERNISTKQEHSLFRVYDSPYRINESIRIVAFGGAIDISFDYFTEGEYYTNYLKLV